VGKATSSRSENLSRRDERKPGWPADGMVCDQHRRVSKSPWRTRTKRHQPDGCVPESLKTARQFHPEDRSSAHTAWLLEGWDQQKRAR